MSLVKQKPLGRIRIAVAAFIAAMLAVAVQAIPPGTDDEIAERLAPVGSVCRAGDDCGVVVVAAPTGPLSGEQVYNQFCFACHATGVGDAPILGDVAAWAPRRDKGMDALMVSTLNGIGTMPARGTCMNCSDDELSDAVTYMLEQAE